MADCGQDYYGVYHFLRHSSAHLSSSTSPLLPLSSLLASFSSSFFLRHSSAHLCFFYFSSPPPFLSPRLLLILLLLIGSQLLWASVGLTKTVTKLQILTSILFQSDHV